MLNVQVITPEGEIVNSQYHMAILCGEKGELGVLAHHSPMLTLLKEGEVRLLDEKENLEETINITGGFAEISDNNCVILADGLKED